MAVTAEELVQVKAQLVPLIVTLLRSYRARGVADPVSTMKSNYQDNTKDGPFTRYQYLMRDLGFGVTSAAITLDPGDFNACVDTAALQL